MKSASILAATLLALAGCATSRTEDDRAMLAMYRAHAGAPVQSFSFLGHINGWTAIGDSAIAVWTRPQEAFLLELDGPCYDLEVTPFIGLTSTFNRVSAKFDRVLVRDQVGTPCRIDSIRPLDVTAVRAAEKTLQDEKTLRDQSADSGGT